MAVSSVVECERLHLGAELKKKKLKKKNPKQTDKTIHEKKKKIEQF